MFKGEDFQQRERIGAQRTGVRPPTHGSAGQFDRHVQPLAGFASIGGSGRGSVRSPLNDSYAVIIACTNRWRTTSRSLKCTNLIPGVSASTVRASFRPDSLPLGKSICVMSPVITAFEP